MLFSEIIAELGKSWKIKPLAAADAPHVRDVWLLDAEQTVFDDDILYFVLDEQLLSEGSCPRQLLISDEADVVLPEGICAAAAPPCQLSACFNAARKLVESSTGFGVYESLMSVAEQYKDIDRIVNAAATKLGNPIIFCDTEFRIIAYSTTVPVIDPIWINNIEKGYCPYEFVEGARSLESVRNSAMTTDTIEVTCTESPYRKLTSKVLFGGVKVGFVLMIASETGISLVHFEMLKNLSLVLAYAVQHFAGYLLGGISPYQQLIYQMLIGAPAQELQPRLAQLSFPSTMAALCIRQNRYSGQQYLKESIAARFSALVPAAHMAFYEGAIAATVPIEDGTEPDSGFLDALNTFAQEDHLSVGVSYSFNNIENFPDHYRQALSAIQLAKRLGSRDSLCLFRDYVFYDILLSSGKSPSPGSRCHPALQRLRLHDSKTGSDLYNTLRCYTETGGIVKDTAARLFIHRNSLNYRLELISKLTGLTLEDPDVKYILRLSFDMDRYSGMAD